MPKSRLHRLFIYTALALAAALLLASPPAFGDEPDPTYTIYLPFIANQISISRIEVTQAVQTTTNSVPLVISRPVVARVYATFPSAAEATIQLRVYRNGSATPVFTAQQTKPLPASATSSNYNSTYNFIVPANFLAGGDFDTFTFTAQVINPTNGSAQTSTTLTARAVAALDFRIVPIRYTHTPNGVTYNPPTTDNLTPYMLSVYPVPLINLSWYCDPVGNPASCRPFSGDLRQSTAWSSLLSNVNSLRTFESAPSQQLYYGFIPGGWWSGGIVGLGYIGWRTAIGLNYSTGSNPPGSATTAAHEGGHNLAVYHIRCTGGESGTDNAYPYAGGTIGHFGLDIFKATPTVKDPAIFRDLMSYCSNEWISDYVYLKFMNDQLNEYDVAGDMQLETAEVASLFIRADLTDPNSVTIDPVYTLPGQPEPALTSTTEIVLLGLGGRELGRYPVAVAETADHGFGVQRHLNTLVPQPAEPVARVQVYENGQLLAERSLITTTAADFVLAPELTTAGEQLRLRWGSPNVPAVVRYTIDGGQTFTALAIDHTGGELVIDPSALPGGTGYFEVLLADLGVIAGSGLQAEVAPVSLTLPNRPPRLHIAGDTTIPANQPAQFIGHAFDMEDGALPPSAMQWWLNGEPLASEQAVLLFQLSPGQHTLTLSARDSAGATEQTTIIITAVAP